MKKVFFVLSLLALLASCQGLDNPSGGKEGGGDVAATAISLNKSSMDLEKGASEVLTVSFTPSNVLNKTVSWVSSNTAIATVNDGVVVGVAPGTAEIIAKSGNASAKCVVNVIISAKSIQLDKTSLGLYMYGAQTIKAVVLPEDSTTPVIWESSDESVATVKDGEVTGIHSGNATITATIGTIKAECVVTVTEFPFADMGLSVKWGVMNLGASNQNESGDYFAWGEIEPHYSSLTPITWRSGYAFGYNWKNYKWANGSQKTLTKYCHTTYSNYWSGTGTPDGKISLDPEDDVVHVKMGGRWRMPTFDELAELIDNCTWTTQLSTDASRIIGYQATSKINGQLMYFPCVGFYTNGLDQFERMDSSQGFDDYWVFYWTSDLCPNNPSLAEGLYLSSEQLEGGGYDLDRFIGAVIRPVLEKE